MPRKNRKRQMPRFVGLTGRKKNRSIRCPMRTVRHGDARMRNVGSAPDSDGDEEIGLMRAIRPLYRRCDRSGCRLLFLFLLMRVYFGDEVFLIRLALPGLTAV